MTSFTRRLNESRIHRSARVRVSGSVSGTSCPSMFMRMKRAAFQILLAKLRLACTFSLEKRMSFPGLLPVASMNRSASAPYSPMILSGSIPLPSDLLILRPCSSRTRP